MLFLGKCSSEYLLCALFQDGLGKLNIGFSPASGDVDLGLGMRRASNRLVERDRHCKGGGSGENIV